MRGAACGWLSVVALAACASHAQHAIALYESGDYPGAARAADSGLAAHPDDESLWQTRVRAALAQGDGPGVATAYAAYRARLGDDDTALVRDLAVATLGQALTSPSAKLKVAAIEAIAAAELEPLADQVAARLRDDDDRVVAAAASAVLSAEPSAPRAAGDMLRSEEPEARRIALDGIARKLGRHTLGDLEPAVTDPDPRVRRTAVYWLGELKDTDAVGPLTARLRDRDEAVRAAAAAALARIGAGDLLALGKQALRDGSLGVRLAGIALLVAAHRPEATAELTALIDDADPVIATEAAIAAGGGERAARALERCATADAWTIRAGAANLATRAIGAPGALALARRLAGDHELAVRLAAARVLAHGGDAAAATAIFVAALASPEQQVDAAVELTALDDARGPRALDAAVRDPARDAAGRAAAASAHRAAHRITPGLVAALADDSGVVRVEAAAALAMLSRH